MPAASEIYDLCDATDPQLNVSSTKEVAAKVYLWVTRHKFAIVVSSIIVLTFISALLKTEVFTHFLASQSVENV